MTGNVLSGVIVISSPSSNVSIRVMHMSFGLPLISALHEPHLPALQFQRTARSGSCVAWMRCTTSSTTIPGSDATLYVFMSPPDASPRKIFIVTSAISGSSRGCSDRDRACGLVLAEQRLQLGGHLGRRFDPDLDRVAA